MTRRQTSTVGWSPRSLAASSTIQAAFSTFSGFGSSEPMLGRLRTPNVSPFMADTSPGFRSVVSLHRQRGLSRRARIGIPRMLALLVEFQNAARGLDVEAAEFLFQAAQLIRGDAVILGAEEQQRHGRGPGKIAV